MALLFDSWLVEFLSVLAALTVGMYAYFSYRYQYWKSRGIPYAQPKFPFGCITDLIMQRESIGELYRKLYEQFPDSAVIGSYQFAQSVLVVRDPDMIQNVLVRDFAHFHDHGFFVDEKRDPLSAHLFAMQGIKWRHMRYKLTPTFTSGKMKMMYPTLVACGKELQIHLADVADSSTTIEVKEVLAKYSTDVIATCAFGIQSNSLKNPDSEFRLMGRRFFEPDFWQKIAFMLQFIWPSLLNVVKIRMIPKELSDFLIGIVRETIEYREKNGVTRNDFMQLLIRIKNRKSVLDDDEVAQETGKSDNYYDLNGMTVEECAAQAFIFFLAGFETSSTTMSFCLYELALNQDVQQQLREEFDSVLLDHGGELTYEAILKMEYLDRVVAETLRKYPPVPVLLRDCTKEYKVPGTDVTLKKGTPLVIPVLGLQRDPQYYPEPDRFDPDRFTAEAKSKRHHYAYLPFGEGPRICIGSRFGSMQTKVGLASLISKYQFGVCPKMTAIPLLYESKGLTLQVQDGLHLKISARS